MSPLLVLVGMMLTGAFAGFGVYAYQRATFAEVAVSRRIRPVREGMSLRSGTALRDRRGRLPLVERLPLSAEAREQMALELDRAGQNLRVSEYLALRMGFALVLALMGFVLAAGAGAPGWAGLGVALALMVAGWMAPRLYVGQQRRQRTVKIEEQLPEALTAMAKSLRAGAGIFQALSFAASETPAPLGAELQRTLDNLRLGAEPEDAFVEMAERIGSVDLDIVATAIVVQRTVGGNLSEVLNNVNATIRERVKIQREVRVLTASQRLMGNLVAALPVLVAALFFAINPEVGELLVTTAAGRVALAVGIGFELVGLWLIRRLSVIEV